MTAPPPIQTFNGVVIVSGAALPAAAQAVLIALRSRRLSGLPASPVYTELLSAFHTAQSANGQTDDPCEVIAQSSPTVPIAEASTRLGVSPRQARRLAPRLGGRRVGGRWLLDEQAIAEHIEGRRRWTEAS